MSETRTDDLRIGDFVPGCGTVLALVPLPEQGSTEITWSSNFGEVVSSNDSTWLGVMVSVDRPLTATLDDAARDRAVAALVASRGLSKGQAEDVLNTIFAALKGA